MGQGEIIEVLKKTKRPMSAQEIAEQLKEPTTKICKKINILLKYGEVECIEIDRWKARLLYNNENIKRRMKLYLVIV